MIFNCKIWYRYCEYVYKQYNMKYKLLFLALFTNIIYSQTTHQYNWGMNSTNQQIMIDVGDTVVWTWGSGTHNLVSTGGVETFDSGYFTGPGPTFSHTFNNPGVTTYICDPHPNSMYGIVTVTGTASMEDLNSIDLILFPNPASETIILNMNNVVSESVKVEIYDVLGKLSKKQMGLLNNNKISIDISDLSRGIYIAKVYSENTISVKRFIKE